VPSVAVSWVFGGAFWFLMRLCDRELMFVARYASGVGVGVNGVLCWRELAMLQCSVVSPSLPPIGESRGVPK